MMTSEERQNVFVKAKIMYPCQRCGCTDMPRRWQEWTCGAATWLCVKCEDKVRGALLNTREHFFMFANESLLTASIERGGDV